MLSYLSYEPFDDRNQPTKFYQRKFFHRLWQKRDSLGHRVGEIGAGTQLGCLRKCPARERIVVDAYDGSGSGPTEQPDVDLPILPFAIGNTTEEEIPSGFFNATFSISVVEHIGNNRGLAPVPEHEPIHHTLSKAYSAFWTDLLRVTAPGGITIHTVDAGVRCVPFCWDLALQAGWHPMVATPGDYAKTLPGVMERDPNAVRQMNLWNPLPVLEAKREINPKQIEQMISRATVIVVGLRKPKSP